MATDTENRMAIDDLLAFDEPEFKTLLNLNLNQLRSLAVVHLLGSGGAAGDALSRQASQIHDQMKILNDVFKAACRNVLAHQTGRGKNYDFTPAGEGFAKWSAETLRDLFGRVREQRRRADNVMVIATTSFSLPLLSQVWADVRKELPGVELEPLQIRTRDFWHVLRTGEANLVIGARVIDAQKDNIDPEFEMIRWRDDTAAVLLPVHHDFADAGHIDFENLRKIDLLLPKSGIIIDFVEAAYGSEWRTILKAGPVIEDVSYGINLLRSGISRRGMLMIRSVADWATKGGGTPDVMYPNKTKVDLVAVPLGGQFDRWKFVSGLVALHRDLETLPENHPVRCFWRMFKVRAEEHNAAPLQVT